VNIVHEFEIPLTEEEAEKLRELMDSGDVEAIEKEVVRLKQLATQRDVIQALRVQLMRDVILNVHHWMHEGQIDKALKVLCTAASAISNETVSSADFGALFTALNEGNLERAKHGCEGSA
jgi:hypothetical protein